MAYSMLEETHLKNSKYQQYYPEESDFPEYNEYNRNSSWHDHHASTKKLQKNLSTFKYMNERKCPIYVHEYNKAPFGSTYNNFSEKSMGKNMSSNSRPKSAQNSKSVLDRLEETYWATWKPKSASPNSSREHSETMRSRNTAHGDNSDTFVKYFAVRDFNTSTASVDDDGERFFAVNESGTEYDTEYEHVETSSRQIQTEDDLLPVHLPKRKAKQSKSVQESEVDVLVEESTSVETEVIEADAPVMDTEDEPETSSSMQEDNSKILHHTDSLVLAKKKQSEVRETYQQPKCIKLYRKAGTSYVRGGTYPLKSCLKRDSPPAKGNFRLGPPGSPLFVTSNSFNKKFGK